MYIYIYIIVVFILLFVLNKNTLSSIIMEKYTDLWDSKKVEDDMIRFTSGLFGGIKSAAEAVVLGFDTKIPGKKPCSNWDSRYRDDGTSCWLDTYGRGAGRAMDYGPCPPRSKENWAKDCYADQTDREDGRNDAEPWGKSWDKSDGCSWNRHIEAGMCFRACPDGYFGRAHEKCWANGANSFGVMKYGVDRLQCNDDEDKYGALCYPKCKPGYKAVGCCLCEPNEGPGIKVTAFDRYECPPPGNSDYVNLKLALCYRDLPEVQGRKQIQNSNNQSIKCNTDVPGGAGKGAVYRIENGRLRWYPNEAIANSWDGNWKNAKMISDCSGVTRADDMVYKSTIQLNEAIDNNRSVRCGRDVSNGAGGGAIYKVEDRKLRWYPSPTIAESWDRNWNNPVTVDDCTITQRNQDMKLKSPNLKNNNILWQRDDYNTGDLYWMKYSDRLWNKYYKISCKDNAGSESDIKGPFGPVNWPGQPNLNYPNIRLSDDNVSPCVNSNVTVYRSDSRDGLYVDISDDPKLFNKPNNSKYNRRDPVFTDNIDVPYVPPPKLKNNNILWQRDDYNTGDLYWMSFADRPWNKYYKFSCKNEANNESSISSPFGPVNWPGQPNLKYPSIRLSDDNVPPCGNNKVTVYRSNSRDNGYVDISDNPKLFNKANNSKYNRRESAFTDDVDP